MTRSLVAGLLVSAAVLTACSSSPDRPVNEPTERKVDSSPPERAATLINEGSTDSRFLELGVDSCNGEPSASFVESDEAVTVAVTALAPSSDGARNACLDVVTVKLATPLGDRAVIDESTGRKVDPAPGPG
jgi:hypothetical protein